MLRTKIAFLMLILFCAASFMEAGPVIKRARARILINKNRLVIVHAHRVVKRNKVYTGNLARAIRHHRYAILLLRSGRFQRAVWQSHRARYFALEAIKVNRESIDKKFDYDKSDLMELKSTISDSELDKEVDEALKSESLNDEDYADESVIEEAGE